MGDRTWTVTLEGRQHQILLRHGYFSARRQVFVDGRPVVDVRPEGLGFVRLWNTATDHEFTVDGHRCFVRIDPTVDNMTYKKFLSVDGADVDSGTVMTPLPTTASGMREGGWMGGRSAEWVAGLFATSAFIIGLTAWRQFHTVTPFLLGLGASAVCFSAPRIVGNDRFRQVLLCTAVIVAMLIYVGTSAARR
jgi:hypothetical protein